MTVRGSGLRRLIRVGIVGLWLPAIALAGTASPAAAETRGYAISMIHTATYGDTDTCPAGMNGGPTEIKQRRLMEKGYSAEEALRIIGNDGKDEDGNRVEIQAPAVFDGISTNPANLPSLTPDPGVKLAQGRFALGFNLNDEVEPDSFEHPETGERGIDNQMWRVLGCYDVYTIRRPVRPYNEDIAWDTALDSMPAWLMSVTGEDLDSDGEVTVAFDRALNVAMRDTHGGLLPGATYVIDPDPRSHSEFRGRIEDGILTIEPGDFSIQGESQFYALLRFTNTQLRLRMHADGSASGIIGGYQPWKDYYTYLAIRGEGTAQVDLPAVYYAMSREADGVPDPVTGENTGISAAYFIEAIPAFHTELSGEVAAVSVGTGPQYNGTAVHYDAETEGQ